MQRLPLRGQRQCLMQGIRVVVAALVATVMALTSAGKPTAVYAAGPIDGSTTDCIPASELFDIPEPGWVYVNPSQKFKDVAGVVTKSRVSHTDFPTVHDSHDQNTHLTVDAAYNGLTSTANPGKLEIEWEIGTFPGETDRDPERTFPKWAWPSVGDHVWANGAWIFDCGHPKEIGDVNHYRTEIHPPRAIASMRDQVRTLPGTGTTPVAVKATDLYIHGHAGFVVDVVECGIHIIAGLGSCAASAHPHRGFPINVDFEFDIPSPPKPHPSAVLGVFFEDGPDNTVAVAPILTPNGDSSSVHVKIPLAGTGIAPSAKYTRRIYTGWLYPQEGLKHLKLTLNKMNLHNDMEDGWGDCQCTFFWMNVNRASNEWIRMSTFATGNMNAYDDYHGPGDGEMDFSGAVFDFYVANGQTYTVRANGYDQDCYDELFGDHDWGVGAYILCGIGPDNDDYDQVAATFGPAEGYGVGRQKVSAGHLNPFCVDFAGIGRVCYEDEVIQYDLYLTVEDIPLVAGADSADLHLTKICKPDGIVLAGQPITCTIIVENPGPGLPRNVVVRDLLLTNVDVSKYSMSTPTFVFRLTNVDVSKHIMSTPTSVLSDFGGAPNNCTIVRPDKEFTCALGTVPVHMKAVITVVITSTEAGDFNNTATVFTDSTDPNLSNNRATDTTSVTASADLRLTTEAIGDVAGTVIAYRYEIRNAGPSDSRKVILRDDLPDQVEFRNAFLNRGGGFFMPLPCTLTAAPTNKWSCPLGDLALTGADPIEVVVNVKIKANVLVDTVLTNSASLISDTPDPSRGWRAGAPASASVTVKTKADLAIVKTSDADVYRSSATIKYTITVVNNGPSDAQTVVVTDNLPDTEQAVYRTDTGACMKAGLRLICPMAAIAAGVSKSFNVYVTVTGSKGQVVNTASATSATSDPNTLNNTSTRTVPIEYRRLRGAAVLSLDAKAVGTVSSAAEEYVVVTRGGNSRELLYVPRDGIYDVTDDSVILEIAAAQVDRVGWDKPPK